jgi:uncharacterized protein (UPF0303 family)
MGRFISEPHWLGVLREQEESLRFDAFTRSDALSVGLKIIELANQKYVGAVSVHITEDDNVIFSCKMAGTTLDNDMWIFRKRNVSKATGVSSLRAYMEIESGLREQCWQGREDAYVACGGCMPVLMKQGTAFAYITVSGLQHNQDHQIIADALAAHLNISIASVV